MAQAPLTQTQLPLESILDINGKQTYLGNSWVLPQNGFALTDTNEHPIAYIANPSGSGKSIFIFQRKAVSDLNTVLLRFYINPTVNSLGSPTVAVNLRTGSTAISISKCYLGSSFNANGTLATVMPANLYGIATDLLFVIDQGNSFLITGQQISGSIGTSNLFLENAWYEI